jgi:hypothetical protein
LSGKEIAVPSEVRVFFEVSLKLPDGASALFRRKNIEVSKLPLTVLITREIYRQAALESLPAADFK